MSKRQAKISRKAVRKEAAKIKIQALQEFLEYSNHQTLIRRLVFAMKILFKVGI